MEKPVITRDMTLEEMEAKLKRLEEKLGEPVGWRILIKMPRVKDVSEHGIALLPVTKERLELNQARGIVVKMGPGCYADKDRYTEGPWCKQWDVIDFVLHAGREVKQDPDVYRYMNDEDVLGYIPDEK